MIFPVKYIGIARPFSNEGLKHYGVDFGWNSKHGGKNQAIYSVDKGTVLSVTYQITGGYVILIKHDGYISEYAHLEKNSIKVKKGDKINAGEQIAKMGNSGICTGYHLHFGIYIGSTMNYNNKKNFVDPLLYLCTQPNNIIGSTTNKTYKLNKYKTVKGVPSEPLNVRNSENKIVDKLYNNETTEYFGTNADGKAIVNRMKYYTTINKYLC